MREDRTETGEPSSSRQPTGTETWEFGSGAHGEAMPRKTTPSATELLLRTLKKPQHFYEAAQTLSGTDKLSRTLIDFVVAMRRVARWVGGLLTTFSYCILHLFNGGGRHDLWVVRFSKHFICFSKGP
jgi:hypothetical protein